MMWQEIPFTRKEYVLEARDQNSILAMLSMECQLDVQVETLRRQVNI